ncbi:MAG: MATE family efflux transporter [Oscillospiraceae bacterium]
MPCLSVFILLFRDQTLGLLFGDAEPAVMENARTYLTGACLSYPFFAIYQAVTGALRGSGDTKAAMVLSVMMNVVYYCSMWFSSTGCIWAFWGW